MVIVDDEAEIVLAIQRLLPAWTSLTAKSFAKADEALRQSVPVAAVIDVALPDGCGLELIPIVRRRAPRCPVLVLTGHLDRGFVNRAQFLGAEFALKPTFAKNVKAFAARASAAGTQGPAIDLAPVAAFAATHGLPPREREVLELFVAEVERAEIAARLGISEYTLKNHVHSLLRRCERSTIAEVARMLRLGGSGPGVAPA